MRPIDADFLLKMAFLAGRIDRKNGNPKYIAAWDTFREVVENQPTLKDFEPVDYEKLEASYLNSRWKILYGDDYGTRCVCPDCEHEYVLYYDDPYEYCPHCGSRLMDYKNSRPIEYKRLLEIARKMYDWMMNEFYDASEFQEYIGLTDDEWRLIYVENMAQNDTP